MYDDAVRAGVYNMSSAGMHHQGHHWYDEPPYESDPDDFLMSGINCGPAATIQVRFIFFKFLKTFINLRVFVLGFENVP